MAAPVRFRPVAEVHGECAKRFDAVRLAPAESLDAEDVGASAAVVVDGELVADVWGGSMVMIDLDARLTVAYVMNQMLVTGGTGDDRALGSLMAAYEGLR
jgi:CubicO group peptidase (beta-lactamase class C family)